MGTGNMETWTWVGGGWEVETGEPEGFAFFFFSVGRQVDMCVSCGGNFSASRNNTMQKQDSEVSTK